MVAATRPAWRVLKVPRTCRAWRGSACCSDSTRLEGTERRRMDQTGIPVGLVAATRPAWRVLKEVPSSCMIACSGGCSDSTRLEGTERSHADMNCWPTPSLQRLDPLGGY